MMYSPLWMRPYRHVTFISHPVSLLPSLPRLLLLSQIDRHLFCPYDPAATMPYFPSLLTNKLKQFKYNHKHKRQENIRRNPRLKAPIRLLGNGLLDLTVSLSDAIVKITARNSIKSRLLHLPAEIRNRVFALALGGYHIHVFNDSLICDPPGSKAFGHTAEIITESTKKRKETPLKPKQSQVPNYVDPKFSNHVYADHNACFHPPNSRPLVKIASVKP